MLRRLRACVRASCVRACVRASASSCMRACVCACVAHTYWRHVADVARQRAERSPVDWILEQQKSIHTVNLCLAALKGTAQCAFHLGLLKAEALMHIKSVKRVPCRTVPTGRSLNVKELNALFRTCKKDKSITGIRDSALLAVMVTTGLRRAEMASIKYEDYDSKARQLCVSQTKGNKDRVCVLPAVTNKLLFQPVCR